MEPLGPFECRPWLAVGVSGGRDSLALALCAAEWAAARGGRVEAVTVDHRLRDESADEARQVGEWLSAAGIAHHVLVRDGERPLRGVEAAARGARYALLEDFCRARGFLHLLVGHHASDQGETQALRRARGSGPDGLAGMAPVRETPHLRILRPFLGVPRARLTATLAARGHPWIEDPSNHDPRFARASLRRAQPAAALFAEESAGVSRARRDMRVAELAARAVALHPAGLGRVDGAMLAAADRAVARSLVARLIGAVGGRGYPPRRARLIGLVDAMVDGFSEDGRTLGGCTVYRAEERRFVVLREFSAIAPPVAFAAGTARVADWDGRFVVTGLPETGGELGALGQFVDSPAAVGMPRELRAALPRGAWRSLPAVSAGGEIWRCGLGGSLPPSGDGPMARFAPVLPLAGARFATGW
jgi:tRNA(Ile)-lysidine synthase